MTLFDDEGRERREVLLLQMQLLLVVAQSWITWVQNAGGLG
ncbi:hypothetical protein [Sinosporangium album]|nr:hypothetical protein [Sinosporangium album]